MPCEVRPCTGVSQPPPPPPGAPRDWHAACLGVVTAGAQAGPHPQPGETAPAPGGGSGEAADGVQGPLQGLSQGLTVGQAGQLLKD